MIHLYTNSREFPEYSSENEFWKHVDSDAVKSMAMSRILGELDADPAQMTDAQCRSVLSKIWAFAQCGFFRAAIEADLARLDDGDQEPDFQED